MASDTEEKERMEGNEWSFCEMWAAEKHDFGGSRALLNAKLAGDYFFNRAHVSDAKDVDKIARLFWEKGMDCYLYYHHDDDDDDRPPALQRFPVADRMFVLKSVEGIGSAPGQAENNDGGSGGSNPLLRVVADGDVDTWIEVFTESFDAADWRQEVARIMTVAMARAGTTAAARLDLLTCYAGSEPAGCGALFFKNGLAGLYCLGTIPRFRRRGVAGAILSAARQRSGAHHLLFLQTLESYNLLDYYKKAGFQVAYQKTIYRLEQPQSN
ncbi:GNAT family N-acetyltransferase [Nitrososphaera sp.]|uniref:GNAT family N-acetyltransferase n=1 Tax=Nitrososphaera sp. TaxID=1971748 RepID=UPI00307F1AAB